MSSPSISLGCGGEAQTRLTLESPQLRYLLCRPEVGLGSSATAHLGRPARPPEFMGFRGDPSHWALMRMEALVSGSRPWALALLLGWLDPTDWPSGLTLIRRM